MQENNSNRKKEEIKPKDVELRDFEDSDTLRTKIFDGVKEEFQKSFPKKYGNVRLEAENLYYADKDQYTVDEQKDAILKNKYLNNRLRGKLKLYDNNTNELLEEKEDTTLLRVPNLTNRGTFIHNGNEYSIVNQSRLDSGIYARKKANGDLEAHVNPERGSGKAFRVRLEPRSGLFKLDIGQSSLHLYSLMHDLGVQDEKLKEAWGEETFETNKSKYDARTFNSAYQRLVPKYSQDSSHSQEQKAQMILDSINKTKVKASTVEKTLPTLFESI